MSVSGKLTAIADQIRTHYGISDSMSIADMIKMITSGKSIIERTASAIEIPSSVASIADYAFRLYTTLNSVTIPSSVTSIGDNAFYNCISLTSIRIPSSVTSIGDNAFGACTNLTDIYCGFAEGAVSGAPWGAPDTTTIHYNATT